MDIILASQSPRRRELLERMGVGDFRIVTPDIDEQMDRDLPPGELVGRISLEKALAVQAQEGKGPIIIAADTVVALDGAVLGKPADELDAFKMLSTLSGCRHQVYTGLTVLRGEEQYTVSEETTVTFRELSAEEIDRYVATGEPMDKAGAYGIQGYGALLVEGIQGDYYNVMGLPVCRLGLLLRRLGVDCLSLAAGQG
ncbi:MULTISPECIES: Maf family protein [Oscillospiraceae]|uniref:Maf family protein n=1 Tax=Oscillospiraceae TaxID=216572 RepID=UPI000B3A50BE|nr:MULTISPECIES: Maf family protein [Oscillospiraceae]MBM6886843.1 septum formation protein Maf [Pseudoflavonifractor phocaeensis]OUO34230.1 septum formation inhibitor Maf [Flavonifractor sp. An306]